MATIDKRKLSKEIKDKYQVVNNAFKQDVIKNAELDRKGEPKDELNVIIGDDKQSDTFYPQVKIQRWTNEANVSFRLIDSDPEEPIISTDKGKILYKKTKREAHFYEIEPNEEHPEGGYEFEVVLNEKPQSNKIEFSLETKELDFFYQPELTQEEKDQGASRPDNVVGSYAVYAKTPKTNWTGGKEYKCGKVGHIFRPKIIDSVGTEVWGDLKIENGILSVAIPQKFLDKAVYPVRHAAGLLFGYNSQGGSHDDGDNGGGDTPIVWGGKFAGAAGTASSISAYFSVFGGPPWSFINSNIQYAIYEDGTDGVKVGNTNNYATNGDSDGFKTATFASPPSITAQNYWLYAKAAGDFPEWLISWFDTTGGDGRNGLGGDPSSWWATLDDADFSNNSTLKYSIYATYTAAGGTVVKDIIGSGIIAFPR